MSCRFLDVTEAEWRSIIFRIAKLEEARREARSAPNIEVAIRMRVGKNWLTMATVIKHGGRSLRRWPYNMT